MTKTPEQLYIDQFLRGLAKTTRLLEMQIGEAVEMFDQVDFPTDATVVDDTRADEGFKDITGLDIDAFKTLLIAVKSALAANPAGREAAEKLYPFKIVE